MIFKKAERRLCFIGFTRQQVQADFYLTIIPHFRANLSMAGSFLPVFAEEWNSLSKGDINVRKLPKI